MITEEKSAARQRYRVKRDVIKQWREQEGRSLAWLSRRIGIKPDTLHQQIRGTCGLSLGVALALEKATGIPVQDLVEEVETAEKDTAKAS